MWSRLAAGDVDVNVPCCSGPLSGVRETGAGGELIAQARRAGGGGTGRMAAERPAVIVENSAGGAVLSFTWRLPLWRSVQGKGMGKIEGRPSGCPVNGQGSG